METATSKKPIIGPVQENETSARVNAIRKMAARPDARLFRLSTLSVHEEGSVISNAPRKEAAKTTSRRQKKILNNALVAKSLSLLAPHKPVTTRPRATYITTMAAP